MTPKDHLAATDMMMARAERLLVVARVAERLCVSEQYVRRLCRSRLIIASRVGREWRIKPSELERYLDAQSNAA